jgi:hypothetical protein
MVNLMKNNIIIGFVFVFCLAISSPSYAGEGVKFAHIHAKTSKSKNSKMQNLVHRLEKNKPNPSRGLCYDQTTKLEEQMGILPNLLTAISVVESGRVGASGGSALSRARSAWPWTVTANGKGQYFPNKAEAIAAVKELQSFGVESIDVGCMQVNLKYHVDAFGSLDQAFDPKTNVSYSARFLSKLHKETGSWITAAQYYHSRSNEPGTKYVQKLSKAFFDVNATIAQEQAAKLDEENMQDVKALKIAREEAKKKRKFAKDKILGGNAVARVRRTQEEIDEEYKKQKTIASDWRAKKIAEYKKRKEANEKGEGA